MNKIRKIAVFFLLLEVIIVALVNVYTNQVYEERNAKEYKVEISRIKSQIEGGKSYQDIKPNQYSRIVKVSIFRPEEICTNYYTVEKIGDELYRFEYKAVGISRLLLGMNVTFLILIILTLIMFYYLEYKVIRPFSRMKGITTELSKGNLTVPIKQEKSKYFKDFLWGLDMLREKLEDDKLREFELLKEKKVMVLSISHDIKTPLSASDLYLKALKKGLYKTKEEQENALNGIEKNLAEIKGYVNEIANVSRDELLTLKVENDEYYYQNLLKEIEKYFQDKCKQLHIDFQIQPTENCILYGDYDRTIEVLQNVIENAIKYGDGKSITISSTEEEGCKLLSVENTGCTIKEEELSNIFDSFYRGSNTDNIEGSGLGLYICKELMHKMDGDIFAKVQDDTFVLTLVIRKV